MSRVQLSAPVRAQLLQIVREEIAQHRTKLDEEYPLGSLAAQSGVRNGVELVLTQSVLLALVGVVCGDDAEREVAKMVDWTDRVPAGSAWLSHASARA